jgi:hypothetical protein
VFVEKVDRLRPATYADEPRYETAKHEHHARGFSTCAASLSKRSLGEAQVDGRVA